MTRFAVPLLLLVQQRIEVTPGLRGPQNTMRWTNRPTMHELMEFGAHR